MIYESFPWKEELLKIKKSLEHREVQKRWNNRSYFLFEKEIFISFYIIRKLIEADKFSTKNREMKIPCHMFPTSEKKVTKFNKHRIEVLYDFSKYKMDEIRLIDLCHQIIHSYIFDPVFAENKKVIGFWVTSDRRRNRSLYCIFIDDVIKLFNILGNDYPNYMNSYYDNKTKDYIISQEMIPQDELMNVK